MFGKVFFLVSLCCSVFSFPFFLKPLRYYSTSVNQGKQIIPHGEKFIFVADPSNSVEYDDDGGDVSKEQSVETNDDAVVLPQKEKRIYLFPVNLDVRRRNVERISPVPVHGRDRRSRYRNCYFSPAQCFYVINDRSLPGLLNSPKMAQNKF